MLRILVVIPNHDSIVVAGNYNCQSACVGFSCYLGLSQRCQVLTIAQFREVVKGKLDVDGHGSRGTSATEEVGSHAVSWSFASVGHQELDAHQVRAAVLEHGEERCFSHQPISARLPLCLIRSLQRRSYLYLMYMYVCVSVMDNLFL